MENSTFNRTIGEALNPSLYPFVIADECDPESNSTLCIRFESVYVGK